MMKENVIIPSGDPASLNNSVCDIIVENMIKNWDITKCGLCGKTISMLNSTISRDKSHFVCKQGCSE